MNGNASIPIFTREVETLISDNENDFQRAHRDNKHDGFFRWLNHGDQRPGQAPFVEYCFECENDAREELEQNPHLRVTA